MSKSTDQSWMWKVDIEIVLNQLGIEVVHNNGSFINTHCPVHDEDGSSNSPTSFGIALKTDAMGVMPPGVWHCKGCGQSGDIVSLYAAVQGISAKAAKDSLMREWDPTNPLTVQRVKVVEALPTIEQINTYHHTMMEDDEALAHWTSVRGWSIKFIKDAKIGQLNGMLKIPIYDADGSLLNLRTKPWRKQHIEAGKLKTKGLSGRACSLYPLNLYDPREEITICEGEPDVGALHSIGVNALTHTGGAGSLTWKNFKDVMPKGEKGCVTICTDNDDAGKKARGRFKKECLKNGISQIRIIKIPDHANDVEEWLRNISVDLRKAAWAELVAISEIYTQSDDLGSGLWVQEGKIVDDAGDEVAPFTATVKASGLERYGQNEADARSFSIRLTHHTGPGKKITVQMQTGDSFWEIILNVGGPEWTFMRRDEDRLFHAICKASAGEAEKIDSGFLFGFEQENLETFWTPIVSFGKTKIFKTEEQIRMRAPTRFLRLLGLPVPSESKVIAGLSLVLKKLYRSHHTWVMGPMIATAFAAPVRRLIMPSEQAFTVMIYGRSGCGKTSRAREVQNLFSGRIRDDAQLESWKSTVRAIQQMCSFAGDTWLLIDELRLPGMSFKDRREVLLMLQGMSQGAGRLALTSQRRFLTPPESRCILAATMEALPFDDDSQLARSIMIHVPMIDLLDPIWKKPHDDAQNGRELLPYAMAAWVHWLVTEPTSDEKGPGDLEERARSTAEDLCRKILDIKHPLWRGVPNAPRLFQRGVLITATWFMLLELARSPQYQAIHEGEYQNFVDEWTAEILPRYFANSFANLQSAGIAEQFITAVEMAVMSGDAHFARRYEDGTIDRKEHYPEWSSPQAKLIGLLVDAPRDEEGDQIWMKGRNARLMINQATVQMARQRGVNTTWGDVKQFLTNYGMTAKNQPRLSNCRGLWLNKKGIERLLKPALGPKEIPMGDQEDQTA